MYSFHDFEVSHFVKLLKSGLINDHMGEILEQFQSFETEAQYEILKYLREMKIPVSLDAFSKALKISQEDARRILLESGRIVPLVLVKEGKGFLSEMLVIKGTSKNITNLPDVKRDLKTVSHFAQTNFAVFFKDKFVGKSFMLPLAVALVVDNLPPDLVFTGRIDKEGNVYDVGEIEKKREACKSYGKRLIEPLFVPNVKFIKDWLDRTVFDIPFYVTSNIQNPQSEFETFTVSIGIDLSELLKGLSTFYSIGLEDLYITTGSLSGEDDWVHSVEKFYHHLSTIRSKLSGREHIHFAMRGPASLGMALGMVYGSQNPLTLYHFQNNQFIKIPVENIRSLKERNVNSEFVKYTFEKGELDEIAVILSFAHHEAVADATNYITKILPERPSILVVEHERKGNLEPQEFIDVARSISSIIQDLRKEHSFKCFHFFLSCPVLLAFLVGMAFGYYSNGYIYNYQKGQEEIYIRAISLEKVRKIREN
jgi:hypothetical protein